MRVLGWFLGFRVQGSGFRVYVLGFRVSGLRGTSVKDPCPAHDNYINSQLHYPNSSRLPRFLAFLGAIPQGRGQIIRFGRITTVPPYEQPTTLLDCPYVLIFAGKPQTCSNAASTSASLDIPLSPFRNLVSKKKKVSKARRRSST